MESYLIGSSASKICKLFHAILGGKQSSDMKNLGVALRLLSLLSYIINGLVSSFITQLSGSVVPG